MPDLLVPRDTSYYRTMPLDSLMDLWCSRMERLSKFLNLNAPQLIIDCEWQLVKEARGAYIMRTESGEEPQPCPVQ